MADVASNYRNIQIRINETAKKCGRKAQDIKLLGAAKAQNVEAIRAAIAAGVTLIGENYVQEAKDKRQRISQSVEWHMIGHLQRNKAKLAVQLFDVVESLEERVFSSTTRRFPPGVSHISPATESGIGNGSHE